MDYFSGNNNNIVAKDLRPKYTIWKQTTVQDEIKLHKRIARRRYKQYLRTGRIQDFNRAMKKITRWYFD